MKDWKIGRSATHLIFLILLCPMLVSGSAPDEDAPPLNPPASEGTKGGREGAMDGLFYAEVEIRDDLLAVNGFVADVLVHPTPLKGGWPRTTIPIGDISGEVRTMVMIRGVSVPSHLASSNRPLIETRRERARFDEAIGFVWNIIQATDYLILTNPEPVSDTDHVVCDVFFDLAGMRLSLAKALVEAGHASYVDRDWGKR